MKRAAKRDRHSEITEQRSRNSGTYRKAFERTVPGLVALHDRVAGRPNIAAYLASERRIPFNEDGIFRHYKALDT